MGLEGRTPAEKAGINVEGNDKWLTIIQNEVEIRRNDEAMIHV
ncbi:MAG: hypothetical protein ABSC50_03515 [Candidatus Bathyarchaeia archaeon]